MDVTVVGIVSPVNPLELVKALSPDKIEL